MQTSVIYDSYIQNRYTGDSEKNHGGSTLAKLSITDIAYALFSWDKLPDGLIELKLNLKIDQYVVTAYKWTEPENYSNVNLNDVICKLDLYALQSPFNELTVTWDNAPKRNLLQTNAITISDTTDITLDLTPFAELVPYGIMLIMNDFVMQDLANKYNTQQGVYPYYRFDTANLYLRTSESSTPPILTYNTGIRPHAPILKSPLPWTVINKTDTESIVFEWESEGQTDRIFEYSQDGGYNWVTDEKTTTDKTFVLPTANLNYGNLLARVKIKGSGGLYSDYSNQLFLQIGERPDTPVVSVTGANTANPSVSWNSNPMQYGYQVIVQLGDVIIADSGDISGGINTYGIKTKLENSKTYTIKVRIRDQYGIWSLYGTKEIAVSFITPPEPIISVYPIYPRAYNLISIVNPAPEVGEEETVLNEIWRKSDSSDWIRIAYGVTDQFKDYTPASGKVYTYKVRAVGQNGYKDSADKLSIIKIQDAQIAILGDYENWMQLKYNPKRSQNEGYNGELMYFKGREKAVVEYDEFYKNAMTMQITFKSMDSLAEFRKLINSRKTLLYRDSRGRKIFGGVATGITVMEDRKLYDVSFVFTETDFNEVV